MCATSKRCEDLPARGLLLQTYRQTNCQCDDEGEQDCSNYGQSFSTPVSDAANLLVSHMAKLLPVLVAPHADAQSTTIGRPLSLDAFTRRAQLPAGQD